MSLLSLPCLIIHIYEPLKLYFATLHFGRNELVTVRKYFQIHIQKNLCMLGTVHIAGKAKLLLYY